MSSEPAAGLAPSFAAPTTGIRRALLHPIALWIAFLLVHLLLGYLCLRGPGMPFGDVYLVYKPWALLAQSGSQVVGIQTDWVYPIGALVPIVAPLIFGAKLYTGSWLMMVLVLDAAAFAILTIGRHRRNLIAAWWWVGFLLLLGPIALARLDSVSVPIVIIALLWLGLRERLAAVLITIATWIKVWPAAILLSVFVALRSRWRVLGAIVGTSLVIVILALTFGSGAHVLSFITMQTTRGLQIEAPISVPWMWEAAFHVPGSFVYYDRTLLTFQVAGPGSETASSLMTPLLAVAVIAVLLIGVRAVRHHAPVARMLPALTLALVATLIAFNKVGSPQYITWLAAPVLLGLVYQGRAFRTPAVLVAVTAALTQAFYPYLYDLILTVNPVMLLVLTARNLLLFVILGWALMALWQSATAGDRHEPEPAPAAVWPFAAATEAKE
ncbi:MAG: hypothetical protein QOH55_312 [Microbacteriaceae bacterium]|jgi:hypothetical protein|nr:hypothetical protein [Microbacteriaceae bacterium]